MAPVLDRRSIVVMIAAVTAIIAAESRAARADGSASAASEPSAVVHATSADRWVALAAAHDPGVCARCQPRPAPPAGVAELVRRVRREDERRFSAPAGPIDIAAELRHVAAAAADDQNRQAMRIAEELARGDLREAAGFAEALPPGRLQESGIMVVAYVWVARNREAALKWAHAVPADGTRGFAVHEVTRHLVAADPREAFALGSALPEGRGRDDVLCAVASHWLKIDRPAALAWVRDLAESPTKTRILSSPAFATETE